MTNKKKDISNKNYAIVPGNDCIKRHCLANRFVTLRGLKILTFPDTFLARKTPAIINK